MYNTYVFFLFFFSFHMLQSEHVYDIVLEILKIFPLFLLKKQEWKSCIIWVVVVWNLDEGENQLKFQWTGLIFAQNTGHIPEIISPLVHRCTIFISKYVPKADTLQMFCLLNPQMNACEPNPKTTSSDFNSWKSVTKIFCFHAISTDICLLF